MSQKVLSMLGAMLVDEQFRGAMMQNPGQALTDYGITLTRGEHEVAARIVGSFATQELDAAVSAIQAACPRWPCNGLMLVRQGDAGQYYVSNVRTP
jgi:hypothetical protein